MHMFSKLTTLAAAAGLLLAASPALSADLPAPSPLARVMQTVGVTPITVEYSSPGVKDREIFGGLVSYGELWRTGANAATKITFGHDVTVAGKAVPAGTYAVFTIPTKDTWTVILNKNAEQGGTRGYDQKLDALRIDVKPTTAPKLERMTFLFTDTTDTSTNLHLWWDETRVTVPIAVDTTALAVAGVEAEMKKASVDLWRSARYLAEAGKHEMALAAIDASMAIETNWTNTFFKADILNRMGKTRDAKKLAKKAMELGKKADYFWGKDMVEKALAEW